MCGVDSMARVLKGSIDVVANGSTHTGGEGLL